MDRNAISPYFLYLLFFSPYSPGLFNGFFVQECLKMHLSVGCMVHGLCLYG